MLIRYASDPQTKEKLYVLTNNNGSNIVSNSILPILQVIQPHYDNFPED